MSFIHMCRQQQQQQTPHILLYIADNIIYVSRTFITYICNNAHMYTHLFLELREPALL